MSVYGGTLDVGTTPTRLDIRQDNTTLDGQSFMVTNYSAVSVFLGGANVAASGANKGYELQAGDSRAFGLPFGDQMFGIVVTGTARVDIMQISVGTT